MGVFWGLAKNINDYKFIIHFWRVLTFSNLLFIKTKVV